MKKATASWTADLMVDCPHCDECNFIDFYEIDEWWCYFGNVCESTSGLDYIHTCGDCGKEFIIDETIW